MQPARQFIHAGVWQWLKEPGLERFELLRAGDEWILRGMIVALTDGQPAEAKYELVCDDAWRTRHAEIALRHGSRERVLRIHAENGRWYENGKLNESVAGCIDIDLGWSPSTNTLPIRRMPVEIGQSSGVLTAAWVHFPELTVQPLPQEYLRTSEREYRYSSRGGGFVAQITVDEMGLVVEYEGFWRRIATAVEPIP